MQIKIKSTLVICLMLLSALFISGNFGFGETSSNDEQTMRNDNTPSPLAPTDFHWGDLEIISEPIVGQDWNWANTWDPAVATEIG